jgi:hypothetical protein
MAWTKDELENLQEQRLVYRRWVRDLESGSDNYTTEQRELGEPIDNREERLARYKRNIKELEGILSGNGISFDD